jgi:hypothetical protein
VEWVGGEQGKSRQRLGVPGADPAPGPSAQRLRHSRQGAAEDGILPSRKQHIQATDQDKQRRLELPVAGKPPGHPADQGHEEGEMQSRNGEYVVNTGLPHDGVELFFAPVPHPQKDGRQEATRLSAARPRKGSGKAMQQTDSRSMCQDQDFQAARSAKPCRESPAFQRA